MDLFQLRVWFIHFEKETINNSREIQQVRFVDTGTVLTNGFNLRNDATNTRLAISKP
jgi:hypothetical protein